jgi:hypothetical protein
MPVWKVLLILFLACLCLGLAMATIAIPISQNGAMKWVWLAGGIFTTLGAGALLALFMRYAGASLDVKPRGGNR